VLPGEQGGGRILLWAVVFAAMLGGGYWIKSNMSKSAPAPPAPTSTVVATASTITAVVTTKAEPTTATEPPESGNLEEDDDQPSSITDIKVVTAKTLDLLNEKDYEQAEKWARRLIELNPESAFGYRCLGSALQDQGKIVEARGVYSMCVANATKGAVQECSQLGGR